MYRAAHETWKDSLKEYFCVDVSKDMNNLSEELINLSNNKLKNQIYYRQFLPASNYPNYDVVVSAYSMMELPSASSRLETVATLWNKTNKYLILIEQGTTAGFKIILEARDFILKNIAEDKQGRGHLFSPCPHDLKCPRINYGDHIPCHFQVTYQTFPQKLHLRKELYSYLVFSKEPRHSSDSQWPRIVKPVLCKSRHTICRLCTSSGTLQEIIFTPTKHGKIPYKCAKSSKWGDRLPLKIKYSTENSES